MELQLAHGDITVETTDAIVNAANSGLLGGGGVDGAIHAAGGPEILAACRELRATTLPHGLPAGQAVATTAGKLTSGWVIHTVGPVYRAGADLAPVLRSCYTSSLAVADEIGATSLAFPLISAGAYGWPVEDAICQALGALCGADTQVALVRLVLFDEQTYRTARRLVDEG
ncbi:O-acetyl-ADP-ribose deacetylase [Nakamurella silvestris]|nr:O-acetyl-ADP-ribose deacetylase [Nakamurella silvestris]